MAFSKTIYWIAGVQILISGFFWAGPVMGADKAPDLPVPSQGTLHFFMDTASFRGAKGYGRQEVYVLIDARQLHFVDRDSGPLARLVLVAAVTDSTGARVAGRTWVPNIAVDEMAGLAEMGAPFRDRVGFDLQPGTYQVVLHARDAYGTTEGWCRMQVAVPDYEQPGLMFSDIQFASRLGRSSTEDDRFVKQGWRVVPNTTRLYVAGKPLSVYFELYNISHAQKGVGESFILGYSLVDSLGQAVKTFPAKRYLKPGESVVKAEILETDGMPDGMYDFQVEAFDGYSREYVRARRRVFLFPSEAPEGLTQLQKDMVRYYMDIRYVADRKSLDAYEALDDWAARVVFLQVFWKKHDPTPNDAHNERLLEHLLRMSHVDSRFAIGRTTGVDTDRGRVYVQYGPPDGIDYHTSAAGEMPYEMWIYEQQRRYVFVFQDRNGTGQYTLVHSTYPGELQNPYWQRGF